MKLNREKMSLFLTCIIYAVSLFATPHLPARENLSKGTHQINKSDAWSISGFTKNELNLLSSGYQVSNVLSFSAVLLPDPFAGQSFVKTHIKSSLFYGILTIIQSGLRCLIFPHHSFW